MTLNRPSHRGFTLSELLIAVAILGVIATFAIPKVLQAVDTSVNKAKFKEAIAAINQPLYEGLQSGQLTPYNNGTYILNKLAGIKLCSSDSSIEGCSPPSQTGYGNDLNEAGIILHNGTMIYGLADYIANHNGFVIDSNGAAGPNTVGVDILVLAYCFAEIGCDGSGWIEGNEFPKGKITYLYSFFTTNAYRDANKALFISLFK